MANYNSLKATVNANIKANNNQEITGPVLNTVLTQMINSLGAGYQYAGIATPSTNPGTPDQRVFYIAAAGGTYTNFGNIIIQSGEIAILIYNGTWTKQSVTNISDSIGNGTRVIAVTPGSTHSSALDFVPVKIKTGEKFYVSADMISGSLSDVAIFVRYVGASSNTHIGGVTPGAGYKEFVATNNIEYVGFYWEGDQVTAAGQVSISVLSGAYSGIRQNSIGIENNTRIDVSDGLSGRTGNIVLDTQAKTVTIKSQGIRLRSMGKSFVLSGTEDFVMSYDEATAPNGAWLLSLNAVKNVANNGTITLNATNVFYADYLNDAYKKNIMLFPAYYGYVAYEGVIGGILLQRRVEEVVAQITTLQTMDETLAALSSLVVVDDLAGSYKNVVLDKTAKTVTIKSQGIRLRYQGKMFSLVGTEDFVMSYDGATAPNGAWLLSLNTVKNAVDGQSITITPSVIFYADTTKAIYRNNIVLFSTYYNDFVPSGLLGEILLQRQIEIGSIEQNMRNYAFNSVYNEVDITTKVKEYSALVNNSGVTEQFVFMTDPHLLGRANTFDEAQFKNYIGLLQKYYNMLPVDWMICGGDWLNNTDTQVNACWKLGYMDATMRKLFKHYYPLLGNHDTNYQGIVSESDPSRGDLTHETLVNLMFRANKNTYYEWFGNNTRFFVFDTQIDWESAMNDFKWAQISWFAQKLLTNQNAHIIILQHIYYTVETTINPMAENIQAICGAFNRRELVTLNGITYNFSGATGKIHCIIAGHSHTDAIDTAGNVPVWLTTNMQDGNTPTFDLMLVDYTAGKLKSIRVGTGNDREMTLA